MKKYLALSGLLNIVYALIVSKMLTGYMNLSIKNNYNGYTDLLVLFAFVIVVTIFNAILYKIMKVENKKIFIAIPSVIFMLTTSILLFVCK